jgi:hypothetical protein
VCVCVCDFRRCGCVEAAVAERAPPPHDLAWPVLTLAHGSLYNNNIGDAGVRDLGAVLQVNTTLMTLK